MKKNRTLHYLIGILTVCQISTFQGSLGPLSGLLKLDAFEESNSFTSMLEKQLALLQEDKIRLEERQANLKNRQETLNHSISELKERLKKAAEADREFISQKLLILNQNYQVVLEIEQIINHMIAVSANHAKLLQEYKQDPEFKSKNLRLPIKSLYTLHDMLKVYDLFLHYQGELKELVDRSKKVAVDLTNRQRAQALARQEYNEKKKHQEEFSSKMLQASDDEIGDDDSTILSIQHQAELLDEEEKLYRSKMELADVRVKEIEQKRNFLVDLQIKTTKIQLNILREEYERIKGLFQVDEKLKRQAEADLEHERQESAIKQKKYKETIEGLDIAKDSLEQELHNFSQQFNLSSADINTLTEWNQQPATLAGWSMLIAVHKLVQKIALAQINKEQLLAQIEQEKTKIRQQEVLVHIISTWYKLTAHKEGLATQEEIQKEIKHYEAIKADMQAAQTFMSEKRALAGANLNANSKLLETLKARMKELKDQKETIFKDHATEYTHYFSRLKDVEDDIRMRNEPLARNVELYAQIQESRSKIIEKIDGVLAELQARLVSKSSPVALLKGLRSFIPDILRFSKDTGTVWQNYYNHLHLPGIQEIRSYVTNIYELIAHILQIIIILLLYLFIRFSLPDIIRFIASFRPAYGMGYSMGSFILTVLHFINTYFLGLFLCLLAFFAAHYHYIKNPALLIGIYLALIPCLYYYVHKCILFIAYTNEHTDDVFLSKAYQKRFLVVLRFLLYSTIAIVFLREAFLVGNYHKSSVPIALLALNFIILQISLVCLIGRQQILNIIPRTTGLWQLLYEYINKYYILLLLVTIFVIFMSNPYVGYGPQFFNIVSRLVLIALLIPIFSAVHNKIKRASTLLFFKTDGDEIMKERFYYGKTSYGIFVIVSFIFFAGLAFIIAANIWGYPIGIETISKWFDSELYSAGLDETGHQIMVTPLDFLKVFFYVLAGLLVAYTVNRFVLRRIFDLLLVNVGIQNAFLSLSRYFIVIASLVVGLKNVGLNSILFYVLAVVGGLGVAGKELITDVIAYFIILIQRPIKIGDFVMLDEDARGVVRHITLRSVFLRRKNSVTVIIPNSHVMNRPVVNWSYSRTFFAFDDIFLIVPFHVDPSQVKELILKGLDNNINILKNPAPIVQLQNFVDNGFQFMIRAFLSPDKVLDQYDIASDVRLELVRVLRSHNIDVASPTRLVKLVSTNLSNVEPSNV